MNIVPTFDSSAASAPTGFRTAVLAACGFFDAAFSNAVTVNVTFSWASLSGGAIAESQTSIVGNLSYATVRNALASHAAATPSLSSLSLPTSDPFSGGKLTVTTAQMKALGLGSYGGTDGVCILNANESYNFDPSVSAVAGEFNAVPTIEHEISEMLGRQCGSDGSLLATPEALLRYTAPGAIDTSSSSAGAYLSLDGGATNAGPGRVGEQGSDLADWGAGVSGDAFGYGSTGTPESVSAADLRLMTALGWTAATSATPTLSGAHGTTTVSEGVTTPFAGVTVADATSGATDTIAIALGGAGGTLAGTGLSRKSDGTYLLAATDPGTLTAELDALSFSPAAGAPGTTSTTRFTLTATSSTGTSLTDTATTVTDVDPGGGLMLSGMHGTTTVSDNVTTPFAGVTIADGASGATDTITIALGGTGGTLAGTGLSRKSDGTYSLAAAGAGTLTAELQALIFTPAAGAPGTTSTTRFTLTAMSSTGSSTTDASTIVTDVDPAAAPTVAGTHGTTTVSDGVTAPFAGVTVVDPNAGARDTLSIALGGTGGSLAGTGLSRNGDGTYLLAATDPGTLTAELDALTFTPAAGASGTTSATRFTLTATSSTGTSATDAATTVTDVDPARAAASFDPTTSGFVNGGTPILTGTLTDPSRTVGVELYEGDPANGGWDLGAATVNRDGTWTFQTNLGAGDFNALTAVTTDVSGTTTTTAAPYELVTAITGMPYHAIEYDGAADGSFGYTEYGWNGAPLVSANDDGDNTHTIVGNGGRGQDLYSIGNDVMTGNGFGERFVFSPGFGQDEVTDFVSAGRSHDTIDLSGTASSNLTQVLRHTVMSGGSATIHLDGRDAVTLDGVTKSQLKAHPGDFAFA